MNMQDRNLGYTNADVVVKLGGWDAEHTRAVAQACLSALKQLLLSDKQLTGITLSICFALEPPTCSHLKLSPILGVQENLRIITPAGVLHINFHHIYHSFPFS